MYNVHQTDRDPEYKKTGGGCLMAAKRSLRSPTLSLPDIFTTIYNSIELVTIKCIINNSNLCISCVYIPPDISIVIFNNFLKELLIVLPNLNLKTIVIGDFNVPSFTSHSNSRFVDRKFESLTEFCELLNFAQLNKCSALDLVFSNIPGAVSISPTPIVTVEDCHPPLDIIFSIKCKPSQSSPCSNASQANTNNLYNFKHLNFDKIKNELSLISWDNLIEIENLDDMVEEFYNKLYLSLDKSAKKFHHNKKTNKSSDNVNKYPKWFSKGTIDLIKYKKNLYLKLKVIKRQLDSEPEYIRALHNKYKTLAIAIRSKSRKDYGNYLKRAERDLSGSPNPIWNFARNIKNESRLPGNFNIDGVNFNDPGIILDKFASFFSSTYENMDAADSSFAHSTINIYNNTVFNSLGPTDTCSLEEVERAFNKLPNKHSAGIDNIPCSLVKHCKSSLSLPITIIINKAILSGRYPRQWKVAKVIPVHKSGSKLPANINSLCFL